VKALRMLTNTLRTLFSGRGAVIGVPYAFLLLFFLLPFFIVFKISVSEMENVVFKDLVLKDGVLQLSVKLATTSSSPRTRCTSRPTSPA
jgi:hypothetical protein